MTTSNLKKMIRLAIEYGMSKENAFLMANCLIADESTEKHTAIEQFRYKLNAEELEKCKAKNTTK